MENSDLKPGQPAAVRIETLHDQVAGSIRDLIIEGYLEPGSRIDETSLIEQLGVSRTPFREALRTLAAEGLVVVRPSKGAIVRKLTPEDVFSMLELLAHLERLAGQLACERATDDEIRQMIELHQNMLAMYEKRDRLPYYKLNQEFHSRMAALARNEALREMQANLQARLKRIRFIGNGKPEYWAAAVAEHEEMTSALKARDGARRGETMATHLSHTWDRVRDSI